MKPLRVHATTNPDQQIPVLEVGDVIEGGIFFQPARVYERSESTRIEGKNLGLWSYQANARVEYVSEELWALNLGVIAYHDESPERKITKGDYIKGRFRLALSTAGDFLKEIYEKTGLKLMQKFKIKKIFDEQGTEMQYTEEVGDTSKKVILEIVKV